MSRDGGAGILIIPARAILDLKTRVIQLNLMAHDELAEIRLWYSIEPL